VQKKDTTELSVRAQHLYVLYVSALLNQANLPVGIKDLSKADADCLPTRDLVVMNGSVVIDAVVPTCFTRLSCWIALLNESSPMMRVKQTISTGPAAAPNANMHSPFGEIHGHPDARSGHERLLTIRYLDR
jgi:hypothetical protein